MSNSTPTSLNMPDLQASLEDSIQAALLALKKDRDRQIIRARYGLERGSKETLEKIGRDLGITRERVRQIEKTAITKLAAMPHPKIKTVGDRLKTALASSNGLSALDSLAQTLSIQTPSDTSKLVFVARIHPTLGIIDDNE